MRELRKELWPNKVAINVDDTNMKIDEIETWLGNTYGAFRERWNAVYQYNRTDYYFRNQKDANWFAMRWS
jgi:hypothetical protein